MFKCRFDNSLRSGWGGSTRRPAFSLTELIVAIGILVLMFSLVGQVFNVTVQSTGQARAMTQVSQWLRAVEDTIREDLRHVQPGRSLILIQGNPVNAYWTQEGMDSDGGDPPDPSDGYPHVGDPAREERDADGLAVMLKPRADILMFFTARKGVSYTHPEVTSDLQQVVYGHANLGEYVPAAAGGWDFEPGQEAFPGVNTALRDYKYPSPDIVSRVPAERWHLARRGLLVLPTAPAAEQETDDDFDAALRKGTVDIWQPFSFEDWVFPTASSDPPWYLPMMLDRDLIKAGIMPLPYERSELDATPPALLADRLGQYLLPNCASFKVEWTLDPRSEFVGGRLDGEREVYWLDPGRYPDREDPDEEFDIVNPLKELIAARDAASDACDDATDKDEKERLCKRFRNLDDLLMGDTTHPDGLPPYSLSDRFLGTLYDAEGWDEVAFEIFGVHRPNLIVFGAARLKPPASVNEKPEVVPEDIFPSALRITIDVFDSERRLERPIRHVIVAPVGE